MAETMAEGEEHEIKEAPSGVSSEALSADKTGEADDFDMGALALSHDALTFFDIKPG